MEKVPGEFYATGSRAFPRTGPRRNRNCRKNRKGRKSRSKYRRRGRKKSKSNLYYHCVVILTPGPGSTPEPGVFFPCEINPLNM